MKLSKGNSKNELLSTLACYSSNLNHTLKALTKVTRLDPHCWVTKGIYEALLEKASDQEKIVFHKPFE